MQWHCWCFYPYTLSGLVVSQTQNFIQLIKFCCLFTAFFYLVKIPNITSYSQIKDGHEANFLRWKCHQIYYLGKGPLKNWHLSTKVLGVCNLSLPLDKFKQQFCYYHGRPKSTPISFENQILLTYLIQPSIINPT